ncbi:hypothetical protein ACFQ2B_35420 [Streptomyces stramineus]
MEPLLAHSRAVVDFALSGQRGLPESLAAPLLLARGMLSHGTPLARLAFATEEAAALLAGVAAHVVGRMPTPSSAATALLLGHLAHGTGWPVPRGGSTRIAEALLADVTAHGGTVTTGQRITDVRELRGPGPCCSTSAPRNSWPSRVPCCHAATAGAALLPVRPRRSQGGFPHIGPDPLGRPDGGPGRNRTPGRTATGRLPSGVTDRPG